MRVGCRRTPRRSLGTRMPECRAARSSNVRDAAPHVAGPGCGLAGLGARRGPYLPSEPSRAVVGHVWWNGTAPGGPAGGRGAEDRPSDRSGPGVSRVVWKRWGYWKAHAFVDDVQQCNTAHGNYMGGAIRHDGPTVVESGPYGVPYGQVCTRCERAVGLLRREAGIE